MFTFSFSHFTFLFAEFRMPNGASSEQFHKKNLCESSKR